LLAIRDAMTWLAALAAAAGVAFVVGKRWTTGARFAVTAALIAIAATLTCSLHAAVDIERSKLSATSRLRQWHTTVVDLTDRQSISRTRMLSAMAVDVRPGQRLSRLGAGEYALTAIQSPLTLSVGRNDPPIESPPRDHIRIPVSLQSLNASNGFTITPVNILKPASTRNAVRATRYARTRAFFFDDWAYLESDGFWTRANGTAEVVIDADDRDGAAGLPISITAGAVATSVTIATGGWRQSISLTPGQKQDVVLPATSDGVWPIRITSGAGSRPSERESGNNDVRALAAWIAVLR
jgi:hypothetical protein